MALEKVKDFFIQQHDHALWYKPNGLFRHAIVRGVLPGTGDPVVLTEYPKSGGTWLSQMMSEALEIPYPRNRLPHLRSQIIHGCYLTVSKSIDTVVVWRDGRDTMVSYYYHVMFDKPRTSARAGKSLKQKLEVDDPNDIVAVMPRFIEWAFNGGYPGYSWADFVNHWHGEDGPVFTSYEAVTRDPKQELIRVLKHFDRKEFSSVEIEKIIENYSFQKQSDGRKPGEEDINSFVRKGVVGDWKNVFDAECRQVFNHYAGRELKLLGYEANDDWV